MTEKELRKLFKDKLDNREFAFNPANWEAMETILDSAPKPAGAFYWRSVMAVMLFGVAVWSLITFVPATAENRIANTPQAIEPVERLNQPEETELQEIELDADAQEEMTEESVAASSDDAPTVAHTPPVSKKVDVKDPVKTAPTQDPEVADIVLADEVLENKEELTSSASVLAFSNKGFDLDFETEQSLMGASSGERFTPDAFKKFDSKSSFYLEVAPIFSGSYSANDVGVGWKAGLGWQHSIGEKFQFNIGLGYTVQNGVGIENNSDSVFYNFGKEVVETREMNRRLDYIELPLSFGYKLNAKNMLELGMYAGYLVNVSRDVNKETSKFKSETEYESLKESGYQKEFKRMDYGLQFGYRYRLTPALSVGLQYNLGLVDITKNTQGDYLQRHTNQNTRVVFRYRIL